MAEEMITITTSKPAEVILKQLEDSLTQLGQASITKKGAININPKAKYNTFLSSVAEMEGTVRQKRQDQYDVNMTYSVSATLWCWLIFLTGFGAVFPLFVIFVPFYTAKNQLRNDIRRALQQAQQELE